MNGSGWRRGSRAACTSRRAITLLESTLVDVPTVIGWLKPVVLLPASAVAALSPQQLEAILAHELAHIRRHDYLVNLLQTLVETVLFYHPAVWWLSRRIRIERENCCDDLAVSLCGDPVAYANALADLESLRSETAPTHHIAMAATGGALLQRVRRLLGAPSSHSGRGPAWLAGSVALLLIGGIVVGADGRAVREQTARVEAAQQVVPDVRAVRIVRSSPRADSGSSRANTGSARANTGSSRAIAESAAAAASATRAGSAARLRRFGPAHRARAARPTLPSAAGAAAPPTPADAAGSVPLPPAPPTHRQRPPRRRAAAELSISHSVDNQNGTLELVERTARSCRSATAARSSSPTTTPTSGRSRRAAI